MNDRAIIFGAESVRAILDGRKMQTRRTVSRGNSLFDGRAWPVSVRLSAFTWAEAWVDKGPSPVGNPGPYLHVPWAHPPGEKWGPEGDRTVHRIYPRVQPGDRLCVRERWALISLATGYQDAGPAPVDGAAHHVVYAASVSDFEQSLVSRWRSPIFMPRGASRLTLEVTAVRVERLQSITEDDARAEGVASVAEYARLWDTINRKRAPWQTNPWVFVIEFRQVTP